VSVLFSIIYLFLNCVFKGVKPLLHQAELRTFTKVVLLLMFLVLRHIALLVA